MEDFKGIVKSEIVWVQHIIDGFPLYITTSDKNRTIYYLYKYSSKDNKYIKTNHQSNDPIKLEEKYIYGKKKNNDNDIEIKDKSIKSNVINNNGIDYMNKDINVKNKRGRSKKNPAESVDNKVNGTTVINNKNQKSNPNININELKDNKTKIIRKKGKLF